MSRQLFLLPASGPQAMRHYEASMAKPLDIEVCRQYLEPNLLETLIMETGGEFYAWGATPGGTGESYWKQLRFGDYVLVYQKGHYTRLMMIIGKTRNPKLAHFLWGSQAGQTWEYIYFLADLETINIPASELTDFFPEVVSGFMRPAPDKLRRIIDLYGSIPGFIDERIRGYEPGPDVPVRNGESGRSAGPNVHVGLQEVCQAFAEALKNSHLFFGATEEEHLSKVRSFVASAATKPFVILTGLSGSGKTQIAMRFGEWLGRENHVAVIPVRPDWTGPEALFGYEDALSKAGNGRRAWSVPLALEFMLKAASDPSRPYLLLLDEMNLAHVERYFADVLSGMESDYPCLPNVFHNGTHWVMHETERYIRVPRNLIIAGTVNVDETTYMFSPKVLDRANTIEFRVKSQDLRTDAERPTPCAPADEKLARAFLNVLSDDRWHLDNPAPAGYLNFVAENLRSIHGLLAVAGFEFGHRVFYEALRFASVLYACGDEKPESAVDLQVMQKLLPRLHGSRRRLEGTLLALARYCFNGEKTDVADPSDFDPQQVKVEDARFPRSFAKLTRMLQILSANQFVSFTE